MARGQFWPGLLAETHVTALHLWRLSCRAAANQPLLAWRRPAASLVWLDRTLTPELVWDGKAGEPGGRTRRATGSGVV